MIDQTEKQIFPSKKKKSQDRAWKRTKKGFKNLRDKKFVLIPEEN